MTAANGSEGLPELERWISSERKALANRSDVPSVVAGTAAVIVALADQRDRAVSILQRWKDVAKMNSIKHDDIDAFLADVASGPVIPFVPYHGTMEDGSEVVPVTSEGGEMLRFKPGDVVSLKSGGPKMTVRDNIPVVKPLFTAAVDSTLVTSPALEHPVTCDWFWESDHREGTFAAEALDYA